eukprot:582992-Hanusia_phi.AAC.7
MLRASLCDPNPFLGLVRGEATSPAGAKLRQKLGRLEEDRKGGHCQDTVGMSDEHLTRKMKDQGSPAEQFSGWVETRGSSSSSSP